MRLHANVAIVVTLGGIREVFYGADGVYTPPDTSDRIGINCIDLGSVGSFREEMPRFGGIAKPSGIRLTLIDRGGQIGALLSRTIAGVTRSALSATIPASADVANITLRTAVTGFPESGYLYLGHETIAYSARDTETLEFTVTERGALGSVIMEHEVNSEPDKSYNPLATAAPVAWKGRKAVVTLHEVNGARIVASAGIELVRGFLAGEPEPMAGGAWGIQITQEIAKFDNQIADAGFATGLVQSRHWFDGSRAVSLRFSEYIPAGSVIEKAARGGGGVIVNEPLGGFPEDATLIDTGTDADGIWSVFGELFADDPTVIELIADRFIPEHDPMLLIVTNARPFGEADGIVSVTPLKALTREGTGIYNKEQRRTVQSTEIDAGLQDWPACMVAKFNETFDPAGADYRMKLIGAVMAADARTVTVKGSHVPNPRNAPQFTWDWAIKVGERVGGNWELADSNSPEVLWFPMLREADAARAAGSVDAVEAAPLVGENGDGETAQYSLPPPALAFWQRERYLLVRDNIFVSASAEQPGSLRVKEPSGAEQVLQYIGIASAVDASGNAIGYRIELAPEAYETESFRPFADWSGQGGVVIEPYVSFVREDPRVLLLRIMLSGFGGDVFPSADYSTLPRNFGLAIEPDAVDIPGILAFPVPAPLRELTFRAGKPASAREMLDPILQALGGALVMKNIGGTRKITLVKVRTVHNLFASGVIRDSDWIASDRPGSGKLDDVINVYRMLTNYDPDQDKFAVQVNFFDRDSIDLVRVTSDVTLKLRGVEVDPEGAISGRLGPRSALVSIYKTLRAQGGTPVRQFSGGVGWSVAANLTVGSVVTVSIADGRKLDGSKGIESAAMLVDAIEANPVTRFVAIRLLYQGKAFTGFNASARVTEVLSANKVQLSENDYSDTHDPITGARQYDWTSFKNAGVLPPGGVAIRLVHVGNEAANTNGTITAINSTGQATIAGHGLSVGDRIRASDWTTAPAFLRVLAFLTHGGTFSDGSSGFLYS